MSGGTYDYAYRYLENFVPILEGGCYAAPPAMRRAFIEHCAKVATIMKAIEWNDSGDGDNREETLIRELLSPGQLNIVARAELREVALAVLEALKEVPM